MTPRIFLPLYPFFSIAISSFVKLDTLWSLPVRAIGATHDDPLATFHLLSDSLSKITFPQSPAIVNMRTFSDAGEAVISDASELILLWIFFCHF